MAAAVEAMAAATEAAAAGFASAVVAADMGEVKEEVGVGME